MSSYYNENKCSCQSPDLKQETGIWLTDLGDRSGGWDVFGTFTFRDPHNPKFPQWTKTGVKYADKARDTLIHELGLRKGLHDIRWVFAREYQTWRGVPHFHALIGGVADLRRDEIWSWWFDRYGFNRILPYDRELGAGYYLCKYLTKELGDIKFSRNLRDLTK